jgi:hypothetical protein
LLRTRADGDQQARGDVAVAKAGGLSHDELSADALSSCLRSVQPEQLVGTHPDNEPA